MPGLGGDSLPGDPSSLPAPGAFDISGGEVPWSMASRRALSAAIMGEGGVSRLLIEDGVYPAPVSSGWKVPTGVSGSPVSMGRCIDSTMNIQVPWSTASRRALSAAIMGEGGVSRLLIKDGVYPAPVSSGWKVPTGVLGSPVSMGRCIDSAVNTHGKSTSIASAVSTMA